MILDKEIFLELCFLNSMPKNFILHHLNRYMVGGGVFSAQVSLRNIKLNKFKKLPAGLIRAFNHF